MEACSTTLESTHNSTQAKRDFHNLSVTPRHMHLLDKPHGFCSSMKKNNLAYQMRYTVEYLESELAEKGDFHVLQLKLKGFDQYRPAYWKLFADGVKVADGTGEYAFECFCADAEAFLNLCRDAVHAAELPAMTRHDYDLLRTARRISAVARAAHAKKSR